MFLTPLCTLFYFAYSLNSTAPFSSLPIPHTPSCFCPWILCSSNPEPVANQLLACDCPPLPWLPLLTVTPSRRLLWSDLRTQCSKEPPRQQLECKKSQKPPNFEQIAAYFIYTSLRKKLQILKLATPYVILNWLDIEGNCYLISAPAAGY